MNISQQAQADLDSLRVLKTEVMDALQNYQEKMMAQDSRTAVQFLYHLFKEEMEALFRGVSEADYHHNYNRVDTAAVEIYGKRMRELS